MRKLLKDLKEEHRNIERLLTVLERELALFDRGGHPDYDVIQGITEYFSGFPDRCHHPKEDLIFEMLRARDPAAAVEVGDLPAEHAEIAARVRRFREAVANVLAEAEVPRRNIDQVIRGFIENERRHMAMENERFFPLAARILTEADWADIEARASDATDPLFGPRVADGFETLREDILRWEREDEAEPR